MKPKVCHHCGKPCHTRPNCRILAHDKANGAYKPQFKPQANTIFNSNSHKTQIKNETNYLFMATHITESFNFRTWYLDSGATSHMTPKKQWFISYKPFNPPMIIYTGDDAKHKAIGTGTIQFELKNGKLQNIHNVLHVPDLARNLLFVYKITTQCKSIEFFHDHYIIKSVSEDGKDIILRFNQVGNLYPLEVNITNQPSSSNSIVHPSNSFVINKGSIKDAIKWHHCMGHLNHQTWKEMRKIDINIPQNISNIPLCVSCLAGKQHKLPFLKGSTTRANNLLELIHSNLCGPMQTTSIQGYKYFVTYINDYSRFTAIYFLKTKTSQELLNTFQFYKAYAENKINLKIKCLRSDNGGEYIFHQFNEFCIKNGIIGQFTIPYTPE